jgi:hypothetical protein
LITLRCVGIILRSPEAAWDGRMSRIRNRIGGQ